MKYSFIYYTNTPIREVTVMIKKESKCLYNFIKPQEMLM